MRSKKKKESKNIFSKIYSFFENKYNSFSDWLTDKGVPINKVNDFFESKGIPAFVFLFSLTLIIVVLILLLTIGSSEIFVEFIATDYNDIPVNQMTLKISCGDDVVFQNQVSSGDNLPLPLKIGKEYSFVFSKDRYKTKTISKIIEQKEKSFVFKLEEEVEKGYLAITPIDKDSEKSIRDVKAVAKYVENGEEQEVVTYSSETNDVSLYIPINRTTSITLSTDGYQTYSFDYTLENQSEQKTVYLNYDFASFSGASATVTVVVSDVSENLVDDATVELYNQTNELIDIQKTSLGRVVFDTVTGQIVRFVVTKDGYRTYDSDVDNKTYRITKDETYNVTLEIGGKTLHLSVLDAINKMPLENVSVKIYNQKNNLIASEITDLVGTIKTDGLDVNENYVVTACLDTYLCSYKTINVLETNHHEMLLEKQTGDNSSRLSVWVYNEYGEPITDAKVSLFILVNDVFIPAGVDTQNLDLTGYTSFNTTTNETYKVLGTYGDLSGSETITIEPYVDNKVILFIEDARRIIDLKLIDEEGREIIEGNLLVKTKDDYVLLEKNLDGTSNEFDVFGYRDLIVEYTDVNGNKSTHSLQVGDDKLITLAIDKKKITVGNYPIVDFVGVENVQGHRTNFVTPDEDYYLVFNILFPENARRGGVHIRAGTDSQKDVDNMAYGITGYKANTTNHIYSKTYTTDPAPGISSIDYLNTGRDGEINKWLELSFENLDEDLGQHQIKVKMQTTDINPNKLEFRYRAWVQDDGYFYRDPKDESLELNQSTNERQALYASTKEVYVDVFETPADCEDDFCVSYKFIDEDLFDYDRHSFFGVQDKLYGLEINLYSFKNTEASLLAKTSTTTPIISFISLENNLLFPKNINLDAINELEISSQSIPVVAGLQKKMYLFFATKSIGSTFIDLFITSPTISSKEERFNFNVVPEKEMVVELDPQFILQREQPLHVTVRDKETNEPIENAFIKITNEYKEFITSVKGDKLNGRNGQYTISQNINSNKINVDVSAYGYVSVNKQLIVGDSGLLSAPNQITINVGENQSSATKKIDVKNLGRNTIDNLKTEVNFILPVSTMYIETIHDNEIYSQSTSTMDVVVNVNKDLNFRQAKAIVIVSGFVGNKHVVKPIEVVVTKGKIISDCVTINPQTLSLSVGMQENSEINQDFYVTNSCDQPVTITPEILPLASREDEHLKINITPFTILAKEQREFNISIKNTKARKRGSTQKYELFWNNPLYVVDNTKLNIDFFNLEQALRVYPSPIIPVSMSQPLDQQPGITYTSFIIRNEGKVPIRDVIVSDKPQGLRSNITAQVQPTSKEILNVGESLQVNVLYETKIRFNTLDDLTYEITGYGPGINTTVSAQVTNVFLISPPGCLKTTPKTLNYNIDLGKTQERIITFTNECAEPVIVNDIDKRDGSFTQAFGNNVVSLYPQTTGTIYPGGSSNFVFKIDAKDYYNSYNVPLKFLARTASNNLITSEQINISLDVSPEDEKQVNNYKQTQQITMPVCGSEEKTVATFPLISDDCLSYGYCDAFSASEAILSKIKSLQADIISVSSQLDNRLENTGCYKPGSNIKSCEISDLHPDLKPITFDIYLQNDVVSKDLIQYLLDEDKQTNKNYSKLNNYLVMNTPSVKPTDASFVGNRIYVPTDIIGCGRYKIKIDASVSITYKDIQSERAYFFVEIEDYEKTEACNKNIQNYQIYLPLDKEISATKTHNTWLLRLVGNKDIVPSVVEQLFENDGFRYSSTITNTTNILNVHFDKITEKEDALAKIVFGNQVTPTTATPERVDIILNNEYLIDNQPHEQFSKKASDIIKNLIVKKQHVDLCISPKNDYILILDFIDIGDLLFNFKDKSSTLVINEEKACKTFVIESKIGEEISFSTSDISAVADVTYVYEGRETKNLPLILDKDKEKEFKVCISPKNTSVIGRLVGEKVDVTAISKYVIKGTEGQREIKKQITLESCGITPVTLLEEINKKAKSVVEKDKKKSSSFVALVSWDNKYNKADKEAFCDSLRKYYQENSIKGDLFFDDADMCSEVDRPSAMTEAKKDRAVSNALVYFKNCGLTCAGCSLGLDALQLILTGGVASGKVGLTAINDLVGCGIGCGIPSVAYWAGEQTKIINPSGVSGFFIKLFSGAFGARLGTILSDKLFVSFPRFFGSTGAINPSTAEGGLLKVFGAKTVAAPADAPSVIDGILKNTSPTGTYKPKLPPSTGQTYDSYIKIIEQRLKHRMTPGGSTEKYYQDILNKLETAKKTPIKTANLYGTTRKALNIAKIGCHIAGQVVGSTTFKKQAERGVLGGAITLQNSVDYLSFENNASYIVTINYVSENKKENISAHYLLDIKKQHDPNVNHPRLDKCLIDNLPETN